MGIGNSNESSKGTGYTSKYYTKEKVSAMI